MLSAGNFVVHMVYAVRLPVPSQSARSASAIILAMATAVRRVNNAPSMCPGPTIASLHQSAVKSTNQASVQLYRPMPVDVSGNATPMPTVWATTSVAAMAADNFASIPLVPPNHLVLRPLWSPIQAMSAQLWNPRNPMSWMSRLPSVVLPCCAASPPATQLRISPGRSKTWW